MKCSCPISGISFEVPHFVGHNGAAIHPALFLPLDKIQRTLAAAAFGDKYQLSHDELHLLTIATIYQLQQKLGDGALIILDGAVKPPSVANILNLSAADTVRKLLYLHESIARIEYAAKLAGTSHNVPMLVLRNTAETPLTYTGILASIKEYLKELFLALDDNSNRIRTASKTAHQLLSLPRGDGRQKALQDIQLSRLTTSDEATKRKAVKAFITRFGNLPEFEITSPITNRTTRCGTFWLGLFELSDNELAMVPRKDIEEFREHLLEQEIQSLHAGKLILTQIDTMLARKNNVLDVSIGILDMLCDHGATFKVLESGETIAMPAAQPAPLSKQDSTSLLAKIRQLGKKS